MDERYPVAKSEGCVSHAIWSVSLKVLEYPLDKLSVLGGSAWLGLVSDHDRRHRVSDPSLKIRPPSGWPDSRHAYGVPVLDDFSVGEPEEIEIAHVDLFARRRHSEQLPVVGRGCRIPYRDVVTLNDPILNCRSEVRKRRSYSLQIGQILPGRLSCPNPVRGPEIRRESLGGGFEAPAVEHSSTIFRTCTLL